MWFYIVVGAIVVLLVIAAVVGNRRGMSGGPSHNPGAAEAQGLSAAQGRSMGGSLGP